MAQSESKKLFETLFRIPFFRNEIDFYDLLKVVVNKHNGLTGIALDEFVDSKGTRMWNYFNKGQKYIQSNNTCSGVYEVVSDKHKKIKSVVDSNPKKYSQTKLIRLESRPLLLEKIDLLNSREYEALACLVLKILGAKRIFLTPPGNEAGIDFVGIIDFGIDAHFLFGINGPIRIIGQCKKYSTESQVNSIKEFNKTLDDVHSLTDKTKEVLPHWFRSAKGPILGWMIAHSGFQSGALDRSKNYGIICSDSKDLSELICCSKKYYGYLSNEERVNKLQSKLTELLADETLNEK